MHAVADAGGGAGEQQVAGFEGDELAHVGDEVGGGEHQLRGAAGLADHAVDVAADREVGVRTADLVGGHQPRPDRGGVLPRLALEPLERAVLPVAHRDVVGDGEPGDGVGGLGLVLRAGRGVPITSASSASQST